MIEFHDLETDLSRRTDLAGDFNRISPIISGGRCGVLLSLTMINFVLGFADDLILLEFACMVYMELWIRGFIGVVNQFSIRFCR